MILADILLQDPENMIWYTGHSLKLCCVVTIMQLETDTNILVRSKPMHMPIYILGFEINFVFRHGWIKIKARKNSTVHRPAKVNAYDCYSVLEKLSAALVVFRADSAHEMTVCTIASIYTFIKKYVTVTCNLGHKQLFPLQIQDRGSKGRPLAPPTGMFMFCSQVGHLNTCWEPLFSIAECIH